MREFVKGPGLLLSALGVAAGLTSCGVLRSAREPGFANDHQSENLVLNLPPLDVSIHACPTGQNLIWLHAVDEVTGTELMVQTGGVVEKDGQEAFAPNPRRTGVQYANAFHLYQHSNPARVVLTCAVPAKSIGR